MKRLLAVLLLVFPGSALAKPVISEAGLSGTANQVRVDLVLTGSPPFHVLYFANPYRIAIDMDAIDWRAAPVGSIKEKLVTGLRHGIQKTGISRLVLDLAGPARVLAARYRADKNAKTHLIIDLRAVSATNFQQVIDQWPGNKELENKEPVRQKTIDDKMVEAAANMTTAAGGPSAPKPPQKVQQSNVDHAEADQATANQANAGAVANSAKQAYPEPLLTSLDSDLAHAQQASNQDIRPGFSSPDGYYVSYMHPPGSLLGAGVTVGMQF